MLFFLRSNRGESILLGCIRLEITPHSHCQKMLGDFFKIVYMFKLSVAHVVKLIKKAELFGLQSHL